MSLAPNAISRLLENISHETAELPREEYVDVLEELKADIEMRLDAAKEAEAREVLIKLEHGVEDA